MSLEDQNPVVKPGGGDQAPQPTMSFWWQLLAFIAAGLVLSILTRVLNPALGLAEFAPLSLPGWVALLAAFVDAEPKTARHLAIMAGVGMAAGSLAILVLAAFIALFDIYLLRLLGMGSAIVVAVFAALLANHWLSVEAWKTLPKTISDAALTLRP